MRANWKEVEEEGNMSDVIKEIFADQFHKCEAEARAQGEAEGRAEGIAEGLEAGRQEERRQNAIRMKAKGFPTQDIADITGLSPEEIDRL